MDNIIKNQSVFVPIRYPNTPSNSISLILTDHGSNAEQITNAPIPIKDAIIRTPPKKTHHLYMLTLLDFVSMCVVIPDSKLVLSEFKI